MNARQLISTLVFLSASPSSLLAEPLPNQKFFEKTFEMSGFLLRSGTVCDEKAKEFIDLSLKIQSLDDEVRAIGKSFPDLTRKWMTAGAAMMNNLVMREGVKGACLIAYMQLVQAALAVLDEQKRQSQRK